MYQLVLCELGSVVDSMSCFFSNTLYLLYLSCNFCGGKQLRAR